MTSNNTGDFVRHSLTWGAICGGILIGYMALLYAMGSKTLALTGLVQYLILSMCIHHCQRKWKMQNADVNFGGLLLMGVCCGVAASIFTDLYAMVYVKYFNPDFLTESMKQSMDVIREMNMYGEAELNKAAELSQYMIAPSLLISNTILYAIISLILGAFSAFLENKKKY